MRKVKLQARAVGIVLALAGCFAVAAPADKVTTKAAKPVETEKTPKKAAAPAATARVNGKPAEISKSTKPVVPPAVSVKPKNPTDRKKPLGGKKGGIPDDSI